MLNKIKNLFNKKILTFGLFLLVSIIGVIGFVFADKKEVRTTPVQSVEMEVENVKVEEQDFLTLNVVNLNKPTVSKTDVTANGTWEEKASNSSGVQGGDVFIISNNIVETTGTREGVVEIIGTREGVEKTILKQTFTPNAGYSHDGFAIYSSDTADKNKLVFKIEFEESTLKVTDAAGNEVVSSKEFKCTPEDIITSNYSDTDNNQIYIKAETSPIEYTLYGYYQADDNTNEYTTTTGATYTIIDNNNVQNLNTTNMLGTDNINDFGYWILRKEALTGNLYNGYTVTVNYTKELITIAKDGVNVVFSYDGEIEKGYKLTSLNKDTTNSPKQFSYGNIVQDANNPLIAAKISREYDLTIKSGADGWNSVDTSKADALIDETTKQTLVGAHSSSDGANNYETSIKIKDNTNYAYKFTSNASYAFYKNSEIAGLTDDTNGVVKSTKDGKYYYVYNYGYQIIGWKIYFYYDGNSLTGNYYGLQYDGSWSLTSPQENTSTINAIAISDLNEKVSDYDSSTGANLADLSYFAEKIDLMFAGDATKSSELTLTMIPTWNAVSIKVVANENEDDSTNVIYNNTYTLNKIDSPVGKEIINYTTSSGNIIVGGGKYNYINIPYGDYTDYSSGKYTLNVTAEYVDNMYKVGLVGINAKDTLDTSKGYNVATTNYSNNIYTYENYSQSDYNFISYSNGLIEEYISGDFADCKNAYISGIAGSFEILNKVYNGDNDYIYLTNNHAYTMPVFKRDYYTLIFYTNEQNLKFKYKTSVYDEPTDDAVKADYANAAGNYDFASHPNWNRKDHDSNTANTNLSISAYWFRKYYNLDIHTFLGNTESFNGYVTLEIEDTIDTTENTKSGNYIVLYYNNNASLTMKIYNHSATINGLNRDSYLTDGENPLQYIKLYAGCGLTLTAIDQSKDAVAALNNDNFIDMIGYRYKSMQCNTLVNGNKFIDVEQGRNGHDYVVTKQANEFNSFNSGTVLTINTYFEQIKYNFNVKLDNSYAGNIKIVNSKTMSQQTGGSEYVVPSSGSLTIGDIYTTTYNANVGFELKESAFTLTKSGNTHEQELQNNKRGGDTYVQTYTLNFTSAWLRDNYYKVFDEDCSIDNILDGGDADAKPDLQVNINTQAIKFKLGLKVYNGTDYDTWYLYDHAGQIILSTNANASSYEYKTFELSSNGTNNLPFAIGDVITDIGTASAPLYVFNAQNQAANYALLSSRMYNPNKDSDGPSNLTDMYNRSYDFLLTSQPNETFELDNSMLSKMVNHSNNKIVLDENRELFVILEVRELYSLNIQTDNSDMPDPDGDRRVTISNGTNNSAALEKMGATTMYSYKDAENVISKTFNSKMYSGIECYLDGVKLENLSFISTANNQNLNIKYIVKPLSTQVNYFIDGEEKTEADVLDGYLSTINTAAFNESSPVALNKLYVGYNVLFNCILNNIDYIVSVKINQNEYELNTNYLISGADYDYEGINIVVKLEERPKYAIQLRYTLHDKVIDGEPYYGEISVYENDIIKSNENDTGSNEVLVSITEEREVYLQLTINEGYKYYGYKYNTNSINRTKELDDFAYASSVKPGLKNVLYICDKYSQAEHAGVYVIYLEKIDVTAKLTIDGGYNVYNIDSEHTSKTVSPNGKEQTLTGLYVNKIINFTATEVDREVLDYFYYTDKHGNTIYLTEDGTENGEPIWSLTINSEILKTLPKKADGTYSVEFKVKTTPKYKLTYIVTGTEYISSFASYVNNDKSVVYNSGDFYIAGTKIYFDITTIEEGKYKIIVNLADSVNRLEGLNYALNSDVEVLIQVTPVTYKLQISENVYKNLYELENSNPTNVMVGTYSGLSNRIIPYKNQSTLAINLLKTNNSVVEAELQTVIITAKSLNVSLVINLEAGKIVGTVVIDENGAVVTDVDLISNVAAIYNVDINNTTNQLKINYTTTEDVNIVLDYIEHKNITPES